MRTGIKPFLLYEEYKRRLDARQVLDHYGAENCSEVVGSDGTTEILHSCLLDRVHPHHRNADRNPSACANIEKKLYVCYGFSGMDMFSFIATMEGKENLSDIVPIVGQFLSGATSSLEDFQKELDELFSRGEIKQISLPTYSPKVLVPWGFSHPYLRENRGISIEASSRLQIGYDERDNRIVFPHFWKGLLVGWQKRAIPAGPGWPASDPPYPKYKNSTGFPRSETLYNYDTMQGQPSVIVVESPMSVAKAVSLGIENVVATFGAKVTQDQIDLLKPFGRVVVWFDDDPAGRSGAKKIMEGLYRHTTVHYVEPDEGRDLGDCNTFEDIQSKLEQVQLAALVLGQWDSQKAGKVK